MKLLLLVATLLIPLTATAENLICDPVNSQGEGHWPISETAFTKENALLALDDLKIFLDQSATEFVHVGALENDKHNASVMYEGYILRKRVHEYEKIDVKLAAKAKGDFCRFLKQRAYIAH